VTLAPEPVAYWQWRDVRVTSLAELRDLCSEELARTVLRLTVKARLAASEMEEAEAILRELGGTGASRGRVGILQLDRSQLTLDTRGIEIQLSHLPAVLRATVARLKELEATDDAKVAEVAQAALYHLYRLVRQERQP
jgi:hypothetical protein